LTTGTLGLAQPKDCRRNLLVLPPAGFIPARPQNLTADDEKVTAARLRGLVCCF